MEERLTQQELRRKAQTYYNAFLDLMEKGASIESVSLDCYKDSKGERYFPLFIRLSNCECHNIQLVEANYPYIDNMLTELVARLQAEVAEKNK